MRASCDGNGRGREAAGATAMKNTSARATTLRLAGIGMLAAGLALASPHATAQVQRSFVNPSFEVPALPGTACWSIRESADVPGWETTEPSYSGPWDSTNHGTCGGHPDLPVDGAIQIFKNGWDSGLVAADGGQWAELNAFSARRLYQSICMANGERVDWSLAHRGRSGTQVMQFNIGPAADGTGAQAIVQARSSTNGGSIDACSLGTCAYDGTVNTWGTYSGNFIWNGPSGMQTIGFESLTGGSAGNYLDNIQLTLRPYIEFHPADAATLESGGNTGVPGLRVSGVIGVALNVSVEITGGTAVLGTDFTAPGAVFVVNVPAGDYGAGAEIPLPLEAIGDALVEGDETVELRIFEDPDNYAVGNTSVCGAPANESVTWTIVDDDVDLSITKDDGTATYVPGFDVNYSIVVANNGPVAVTGVQVADPLPAGIADASWTCGDATGGGACGAASGTGAIDTTADLPAGASVTYTLTLLVPPDYVGDLANTATVSAPDGFNDIDPTDNTATDIDAMEPPPTSGACSPIAVVQGDTFSLAPFPTTGTVQKSAAGGWQVDQPWATTGGNYTITWTFSQPVPASWIQFSVVDVNEPGNDDYQADPPVFTIALGAGSTATLADFSLSAGDLAYSGGALRYQPGGPYRQSGHLRGDGANTVTAITISSSAVGNSDFVANALFVRPACVTLQKTSEEGTGSFDIDMGNVVEADGSGVPAVTLATTAADTPVSSPGYYSILDQDVTLSEVVPAGWNLETAVCTDQNAGSTGNPPVIGSFSTPTLTIPAANVRPQSDIHCLFTNRLLDVADLVITKTASEDEVASGDDVSYTLQVVNNGPDAADGAVLTDPQPPGLDCSAGTLVCGAQTNGAVCPASPTIADLQGAGVTIPTFPADSSLEFVLTCKVTATGTP